MNISKNGLIDQASTLVVIDDGASRWVGDSAEILGWLTQHGIQPRYDSATRMPDTCVMGADAYQHLCAETGCVASSCGSYGPVGEDPLELIEDILTAGARLIYVR